MLLIRQDVLIVDAGSDLNVYVDMTEKEEQENASIKGCCDSTGGDAKGNSSVESQSTTPNSLSAAWNLSEIDINEWAGKLLCSLPVPC